MSISQSLPSQCLSAHNKSLPGLSAVLRLPHSEVYNTLGRLAVSLQILTRDDKKQL